jgi:WD40 repeat protein
LPRGGTDLAVGYLVRDYATVWVAFIPPQVYVGTLPAGTQAMIFRINRSFGVTAFIFVAAIAGTAQRPELIIQTGHSSTVISVAFSPDGKMVASGSLDHTIKLWDVSTGTELGSLKGDYGQILSVAFSPDGKTLASSSANYTIKLWDVWTGTELHTLKLSGLVQSVAFSPDGKTLASGSSDNLMLWDVSTGSELRIFKKDLATPHWVKSVAFSPDGKTLANNGLDNVTLWDVSTGEELWTVKGFSKPVQSLAFSPDGKTLASGSEDNMIKLWDVSNGKELRTLEGHSREVNSVAFSPDGKTLASGSNGFSDNLKLWNVSNGQELRKLKGHSSWVYSVAFSPDGKSLASGSGDNTIKLWDPSTGAELRALEGHSRPVNSVAVSPDGNTLASGSLGTVKLWNVSTELRTLKGDGYWVHSVTFGAGNTLASGSNGGKVKLWDVSTGIELRTVKGQFDSLRSVAFSPDGKTLAIGIGDSAPGKEGGTIKLWDVSTDREMRILKGHTYTVEKVAFSPDGKTLASGSWDHTVRLWDFATGKELRTLIGHSRQVEPVAFSPDGKTLASGSWDETVKMWDVATGTLLHTLEGHSKPVESVAFSPDGKTLASGSDTLKLWDASTGTELRTLTGHSREVRSVAFSPNSRYLVSGSEDNSIKIWEVTTGKELATLIAFDEKDWIIVTPDGLFDGSAASWNKIVWRFNNNTFDYAPAEAYFGDFYYPGLLNDIVAGKAPKAPSDISKKDRRQPQLKLTLVDARPDTTLPARNLKVKINISQAQASAQDARLFRNGSLVKVWHGDVLKGQNSVVLEATVPIIAGENRLAAYAFNRDNVKSSDATLNITGADILKRKGVVYVLAVGVNQYANARYNLKYAVADAQAFAEELKRQQTTLGNYERVEVMSLTDKDATKASILKLLTDLPARIQPEDAVVIYFAGHGTAQGNRFYLVPHDLGYTGSRKNLSPLGLQRILAHSISDEELERAIEGIDAGQLLLVIDACNSGQALETEEKRRGPMNSKGLAQLAYEKGMYILTAAQSYQAALEASRLGHGYLTYALVEEGLKTPAADVEPKDSLLLLREWLDYATNRVPQMQQEMIDQGARGVGLEVIFVEGDEKIKEPNKRSLQRPRVFYRRETETSPFVVAKP